MEVTFTKGVGRYDIAVRREHGHALAPRNGPGFHRAVPHDVAHLIVESEAAIRGAVYGRLASGVGDDGMFWAADPAVARRVAKKAYTPTGSEAADMARSERLASLTVALWEVARGRRPADPAWPGPESGVGEPPEFLTAVYRRYDEFAARWETARVGAAVTLAWPFPEGSAPRRRR